MKRVALAKADSQNEWLYLKSGNVDSVRSVKPPANPGDNIWPDWRFFVFHFTIHLIQLLSDSFLDENVFHSCMSYPYTSIRHHSSRYVYRDL